MSPANTALISQAQAIVATLGLRNDASILVGTNDLGPPVSIKDIKTVISALVASIAALDP